MKAFLLALALSIGAFSLFPASAQVSGGKLPTRWDTQVSPTNPLPEYPRPQMTRPQWQSLNGPWDYALTGSTATAPPTAYGGKILVPYPYEAALSGIGQPSIPDQRLWYKRTFTVPADWRTNGRRVLLHFGAVNWDCTAFVNGQALGEHKGGYDGFEYDITPSLKPGANELLVSAWNPVSSDNPNAQVIGKQRLHPGGVLYTAATGIWQSVWLEPVFASHIVGLKLTPDIDSKALRLTVQTEGTSSGTQVNIIITDGKTVVAKTGGTADQEIRIPIPRPHLWSPDDPHLYALRVSIPGQFSDTVGSYFAMRKISLGKDTQGRTCVFLNNKYIFQVGALDQGYWPDGIYTAPTDDALHYDIDMAKQLGFNLLRKHAKVEPDRWYYWTDKLGMLVWQDIPQAFGDNFTDTTKQQWLTELRREIATHSNHPSIIVWTLFNEGWGQHDTEAITALARQLDPTRLINSASGGYNQLVDGKPSGYRLPTPSNLGDINDTHTYPDPTTEKQDPTRALVCGEFGGVGLRIPGHLWSSGVFGYGAPQKGGWELTRRYQKLWQEAYGLRDTLGASGVVYTQLTDVEEETNGLLTYDRAIVKPIAAIVKAANQGRFLSLPPPATPTGQP
jgi:beta-galactosidase/beta-glucuronidase